MRKVLFGCGIVAALFVVVSIVIGVVVSSWFKDKFPDMDRIEDRQAEMRERFGDPESFTPPLDGGIPRERIEIFVALRDSLSARRDSAAVGLAAFVRTTKRDRAEDEGRIARLVEVIGMARGGAEMVSGILDYFGRRQERMLEAGMGDGEYAYWYCLTSFSWLEWDPLGRPEVEEVLREIDMRSDAAELRSDLLRTYRRQLRNLREALEAKEERSAEEERTLARVAAELGAERADGTAPFAGAVPPEWAATLEPYRDRLRAALPEQPGAIVLDLVLIDDDRNHFRFQWGDRSGRH